MTGERLPIFPYLLTEERFAEYDTDPNDPPVVGSFFDLLVTFVWNSDEGFSFVSSRELEELGLTVEGLTDLATEDLARHASGSLRVEKRDTVFGVFMGGNFEASFVLSEFFWEKFLGLKFPNGCVVALPANDMLTFCDPSSVPGIQELKQVVARTFNGGEDLLTPVLYERRQGAWSPFAGDVGKPN